MISTLLLAVASGTWAPVSAQQNWSLDLYAVPGDPSAEVPDLSTGQAGSGPPWGLRVLHGPPEAWQLGVEVNQVTRPLNTPSTSQTTVVTANAQRDVTWSARWSAHAALGLGIVRTADENLDTNPVLTNPAARLNAEAHFALTTGVSAFAAYSGLYTMGRDENEDRWGLTPEIMSSTLNVGIGFSF